MNIIDAIKSGKKIKHGFRDNALHPATMIKGLFDNYTPDLALQFLTDSEWEIEEKSVTVTRKSLSEALARSSTNAIGYPIVNPFIFQSLLKELGLEEK